MYYQVDEFQNEPHAILSNEIYRLLAVKDLAVLKDVSAVDQAQKQELKKMRARQEFLE